MHDESFLEHLQAFIDTEIHFATSTGELLKTAADATSSRTFGADLIALFDTTYIDAWVITAENPNGVKEDDKTVNASYMSELEKDLLDAGYSAEPVLGAARPGAEGGDWAENSYLVFGKTPETSKHLAQLILKLAQKYEQLAVFHLIDGEQVVVPVLDPRFHGSRQYTIEYSDRGGLQA